MSVKCLGLSRVERKYAKTAQWSVKRWDGDASSTRSAVRQLEKYKKFCFNIYRN